MRKSGKRPQLPKKIVLQEKQGPRKGPPRRSKDLDIRDPVVTAITIDGGLDSHEIEALQLELRALASACGLEVTALEVGTPAVKAASKRVKTNV